MHIVVIGGQSWCSQPILFAALSFMIPFLLIYCWYFKYFLSLIFTSAYHVCLLPLAVSTQHRLKKGIRQRIFGIIRHAGWSCKWDAILDKRWLSFFPENSNEDAVIAWLWYYLFMVPMNEEPLGTKIDREAKIAPIHSYGFHVKNTRLNKYWGHYVVTYLW